MDAIERLDKMAKWASGIETDIARLNDALATSDVALADTIAADLGALYEQYSDMNATLRDAEEKAGGLAFQINDAKEQMGDVEADAFLDVSAQVTESGEELYSNDTKRKAAVRLVLRGSADYQVLRRGKRALDTEKLGIRVLIEEMERGLKEYDKRNTSLVARLNNLTARIK